MVVDSITIGLVVDPLAVVNVSINVCEFSLSVGSIVLPETFVPSTVGPLLYTEAISESTDPLASVSCP